MPYLNLNVPSKTLLLEIVNKENDTTLDATDVQFTSPVALPSTEARNTTVTVVSLPSSPYSGNQRIDYDRLNLKELIGVPLLLTNGPVYPLEVTTETLNAECGLALVPEEIAVGSITEAGEVTVTTKTSYIFLPNTTFQVKDEFDDFVPRLWTFANHDLPAASNQN